MNGKDRYVLVAYCINYYNALLAVVFAFLSVKFSMKLLVYLFIIFVITFVISLFINLKYCFAFSAANIVLLRQCSMWLVLTCL